MSWVVAVATEEPYRERRHLSIYLPILIPAFPLFVRRPVADGLLADAEFAELGAVEVHFQTRRVVFGQESLLEKQELLLCSIGVVDDGDEEPLEVDFDAGEQLWQRGYSAEVTRIP